MLITSHVEARGPLRAGDKGNAVTLLQLALRAAGHQLLIDGHFGKITYAAVRCFQAATGLTPDGVVGKITAAALDSAYLKAPETSSEQSLDSVLAVAPWLSVMRAITGTREIRGALSNPLIIGWRDEIIAKYPDLAPNLQWYVNDDTPWCGLGNAYTLVAAGFRPASAPLWALNNGDTWVREGHGIKLPGPAIGAVVTMRRDGGGHVTQYEGQDDEYWFGRGCNQSNTVNVARYSLSRPIEGYYWPKGHPLPPIGPVRMSFAGAVAGTEA